MEMTQLAVGVNLFGIFVLVHLALNHGALAADKQTVHYTKARQVDGCSTNLALTSGSTRFEREPWSLWLKRNG